MDSDETAKAALTFWAGMLSNVRCVPYALARHAQTNFMKWAFAGYTVV